MTLDPHQHAVTEQHVAGFLADLDTAGLRELAGDFLRLRTRLQRSMPDRADWYADDDGDEIALFGEYLDHLTGARHGDCVLCGTTISAGERYEGQLPRQWHPRQLRHALGRLYRAVRYGTPRIAHASCRYRELVARRRPATTYTHPDVLTIGVRDGWADPQTDPTRIDWAPRQAAAAIGFDVIDGRPVNPCQRTAIRYGRGELGHWGEALAADAIVTADDNDGHRWLLMVKRADGHGWALPGGMVEPGEDPADAAVRELTEETGVQLPRGDWAWDVAPPVYVPDPRASDEAWIVTVACSLWLGRYADPAALPAVAGADDADRAAWIRADSYDDLTGHLALVYDGWVFAAHEPLLRRVLAVVDVAVDPLACANCGAPTGGQPCTISYGGGPSCADVLAETTATSEGANRP
jgi:ADP-ribose pyrophosphatase